MIVLEIGLNPILLNLFQAIDSSMAVVQKPTNIDDL